MKKIAILTSGGDAPHRAALRMVGFEDTELSRTSEFPSLKRQLLDKLQVKLTVLNA